METLQWVVAGIVLIGATAFVLVWWRIGDQWADEEQRKFPKKRSPHEGKEKIVIKSSKPEKGAGQ